MRDEKWTFEHCQFFELIPSAESVLNTVSSKGCMVTPGSSVSTFASTSSGQSSEYGRNTQTVSVNEGIVIVQGEPEQENPTPS